MSFSRQWTLVGPNSEGMYVMRVERGMVHHEYSGGVVSPDFKGPTEESIGSLLLRGYDPGGAGGAGMAAALEEIRASFDGWISVNSDVRLRYVEHLPVEIDTLVMCGNVGNGGHCCTRTCAPGSPRETARVRALAERFAGGPLSITGTWEFAEMDDYVSYDRAPVKLLGRDGWFDLEGTYTRLRYEAGEPVELETVLMCADSGLGGHVCSRTSCAKVAPGEREAIQKQAEQFLGGPIVVGEWTCVPDEDDRYRTRDRAPIHRLP